MSSTRGFAQRSLRVVAVLLALGMLVAVMLWLRRRPTPMAVASPEQSLALPEARPRARARGTVQREAVPVAPARSEPAEADQPIVDAVTVDKTEVCRGEENFVNVKARTRNGTDGYLATHFVDPTTRRVLSGTRIPFRLEAPVEGAMEVIVEGRGGASQTGVLPYIAVKDCWAPQQVLIDTTRPPASPDRVSFVARVTEYRSESEEAAAPTLSPSSYDWDFGDGTKQTTTSPEAEHSYEAREQNASQSYFVVTVKVRDRGGSEVSGSRSLWFPNVGFLALALENRIAISVGVRDANPTTGAPEQIWLYHGYSSPVRIDRVTLRETVLDASDAPERQTMSRDYTPDQLLGFSDLPAGQIRTARDLTTLQPSADTAVRYVEITGHAADGRPASGTFTLLPPKRPIATN